MENLDLDINNYSLKDIEIFFKLKSNANYTSNDVELKEYEIREQLLKSGHIDKRFKNNLISFLTSAKNILINAKCKPNEKQPSVIPKNYKLDKYDYPLSKEPVSRENELVKRTDREYVYTNNSDYFPGVINPLNKRIITKCLNIDTKFRDTLTITQSSDFTIQLTTKLNKVVSMELSAIEIPISFYSISQHNGNNYLYIKLYYTKNIAENIAENIAIHVHVNCDKEYDNDDDTNGCQHDDNNDNEDDDDDVNSIFEIEKIFIIPDGNYTAIDLINKLNNIISPKDPDSNILNPDDIFSYLNFNLDVNENGSGSGKVWVETVGLLSHLIKKIHFDFTKNINGIPDSTNIATRLGWSLGFHRAYYDGDIYYEGESVIDCKNTRYIYLSIDDFNKNANNPFISVFNQSILNDDVLARISIEGSLGLIKDNKINFVTEPRQYFGPVDIQRLRIRLFDEFGRILQMNGANYSFCLKLNLLYDL
jgi:hypothetical protein